MAELELTVVVAAPRRPEAAAAAWTRALDDALARGVVELVVVTTEGVAAPPGTSSARTLALPAGTTVPRLRAAGIRAARAGVVALTEDSCEPDARWLGALLAARASTGAAVVGGPVDRAAGRTTDWAHTLVEFGRFLGHGPPREVREVPGVNVSFSVERLRAVMGGLPEEYVEAEVRARLRAAGVPLWIAPDARVVDVGRWPLRPALRDLWHHGRLFGARRARGFGARVLGAAAALAAPLVQGARMFAGAARGGRLGRATAASVPAALLLVAWGAGELVGAVAGAGRSGERWT